MQFLKGICLFVYLSIYIITSAEHISFDVAPGVIVSEEDIKATVVLKNFGKEPAYDVIPMFEYISVIHTGEVMGVINPGESRVTKVNFPYRSTSKDVIWLKLVFRDVNGYPFSTVDAIEVPSVYSVPDGTDNIKLSVVLRKNIKMYKHTTVIARIICNISCRVKIKVYSCDRLKVTPADDIIFLNANEPVDYRFSIDSLDNLLPYTSRIFICARVINNKESLEITSSDITVDYPWYMLPLPLPISFILILFLIVLCFFIEIYMRNTTFIPLWVRIIERFHEPLILLFIFIFQVKYMPLSFVFKDTIAVGGDTPAHNYLLYHLKKTLEEGRIISWAMGWWCGFPVFQFYFPLPYIVMAIFSLILPFNIAFKIGSILPVLVIPSAAMYTAKLIKFPSPLPSIFAITSLIFLYDDSYVMWGGNIYSLLAGMIANEYGIIFMILFIGFLYRDIIRGSLSIVTPVIGFLMLLSHFFTSVIGIITGLLLPLLLFSKDKMVKNMSISLFQVFLSISLAARWLIPLFLKREYSVAFGTNWNINFWHTVPLIVKFLLPFSILSILKLKKENMRQGGIFLIMAVLSLFLFFIGYKLDEVFVNVRLWPYWIMGITFFSSVGLAVVLKYLKSGIFCTIFMFFILTLLFPFDMEKARQWWIWNYEGLEMKPDYFNFKKLMEKVKDSTGRIGYDLSAKNNSIGSSRIFELIPYLTGKSILEGGIVNSALSSLLSYYIQSECSLSSAGYPNIVKPAKFNIFHATCHLKLCNVQYFIARENMVQEAFKSCNFWTNVFCSYPWCLFELKSKEAYVYVPRNPVRAVRTSNRHRAIMEWLYHIEAINCPYVFLKKGESVEGDKFEDVIDEEQYYIELKRLSVTNRLDNYMNVLFSEDDSFITFFEMSDMRISFRTKGVNLPHIIKVTFYPNWKVKGAKRIYMVSPCFMLVFPEDEYVEIYFTDTFSDWIGKLLSITALLILFSLRSIKLYTV